MLRGHTDILDQFRRAISRGRLASTFLFVGRPGIGKRLFALRLAQSLLCERRPEEALDPCSECPSCRQVLAGTHPDVQVLAKPADKAFIPVEALIGDKEHRMREGLCYQISLKPYSGRRKVAILDDADYLNKEGANCLLKTLEEPPAKSVLILIGTSEQRQLPTIRSRCQVVRFGPLAESDVAAILLEQQICTDAKLAQQAAAQSDGSVERAALWCNESVVEFRGALFSFLSQSDYSQLDAAKLVGQFADEAGKDAAAKRSRLKLAISLAEDFYRELLLALTRRVSEEMEARRVSEGAIPTRSASEGAIPTRSVSEGAILTRSVSEGAIPTRSVSEGTSGNDPQLAASLKTALRWFPGPEAAAACIDVCLDATAHVDANANQATLIDWWVDELASAARSGRVVN